MRGSLWPAILASSAVSGPTTPASAPAASTSASATFVADPNKYKYTRLELESKENFEKGNFAEAYGHSPEAGAIGELGLLQKYGAWTVGSLFLASAISKEWIMIGSETPLVLTFSAVVFTLYVTFRDGINSSYEQARAEQIKSVDVDVDVGVDVDVIWWISWF